MEVKGRSVVKDVSIMKKPMDYRPGVRADM
jgi:hypothetical protein